MAQDESTFTSEESREFADQLTMCAGYYGWLEEAAQALGRPAAADHIRGYRNGAKSAALYLEALAFRLDNPDAPARTYGSFSPLVDGPIESSKIRIRALQEAGNEEQIARMDQECEDLKEATGGIITLIREEMAGT
ncbi:hypothetical protein [Lysobacter sp. A3-1-A15]|uniref:hypothetical protein n=1 Tax=Novilysobacter viscosus TaxID=3098602 RepID=UPI002EDA2B53